MIRMVIVLAAGSFFLVLTASVALTMPRHGTSDNDVLHGTNGVDQMFGHGGDDHLYGGFGNDALYGGRGDDYVDAKDGQADYVHCGSGEDSYDADAIDYVTPSCDHPAPQYQEIRTVDPPNRVKFKATVKGSFMKKVTSLRQS